MHICKSCGFIQDEPLVNDMCTLCNEEDIVTALDTEDMNDQLDLEDDQSKREF